MTFSGLAVFPVEGFSCKAAPGTTFAICPAASLGVFIGKRFLPLFCFLHLRTMTGGALTTSPGVRIGTNAAHNNVAPLFTPGTGIAVGVIGAMPLASPMVAPALDSADILLELFAAAVGPTTMTADAYLVGLVVG